MSQAPLRFVICTTNVARCRKCAIRLSDEELCLGPVLLLLFLRSRLLDWTSLALTKESSACARLSDMTLLSFYASSRKSPQGPDYGIMFLTRYYAGTEEHRDRVLRRPLEETCSESSFGHSLFDVSMMA